MLLPLSREFFEKVAGQEGNGIGWDTMTYDGKGLHGRSPSPALRRAGETRDCKLDHRSTSRSKQGGRGKERICWECDRCFLEFLLKYRMSFWIF